MELEGTSSRKDLCTPSHYKQKCFCGWLLYLLLSLTDLFVLTWSKKEMRRK